MRNTGWRLLLVAGLLSAGCSRTFLNNGGGGTQNTSGVGCESLIPTGPTLSAVDAFGFPLTSVQPGSSVMWRVNAPISCSGVQLRMTRVDASGQTLAGTSPIDFSGPQALFQTTYSASGTQIERITLRRTDSTQAAASISGTVQVAGSNQGDESLACAAVPVPATADIQMNGSTVVSASTLSFFV